MGIDTSNIEYASKPMTDPNAAENMRKRNIEMAEQSAEFAAAFYHKLRTNGPIAIGEEAAAIITAAWVRNQR